GGKKKYQL
nr:Chain C, HIV-1 GAG PEPTIDE (GGKKKYQL - 7Q MUTATION)